MATPSFDLSGLVMLESEVATMLAAQATNRSIFSGAAPFTATYANVPASLMAASSSTTETTSTIALRIKTLELAFQQLNR
jgi:hypothetical protein